MPKEPIRATVKIRYNAKDQPATLRVLSMDEAMKSDVSLDDLAVSRTHETAGDEAAERVVEVLFDEPQRAIAPGQAAVAYQGDTVLGGGTIVKGLSPSTQGME